MSTPEKSQTSTLSWLETEFGLRLSVPNVGERYEQYDALGAGGAAEVFLALDKDLEREVAIKVLRAHRRASRDSVIRFLNEARITARLQHPGIVPIHDIGLIRGELFFSMERVDGKTLRELLDERIADPKQGLSTDQFIRLYEQVCQIVAYAHAAGIVHRDLKPDNIMVGEFNKVYVMDWGVALDQGREPSAMSVIDEAVRHLESAETLDTMTMKRLPGTPRYMAPEQILGMQQVDARCDVFALGIILYEILSGEHPFPGDTSREVMHAIKTESPAPIKTHLNRDLKLVCMKALNRLPEDRYLSAGQVATDINRAINLYPVSAREDKVVAHVLKAGRRHWIVILVLLVIGGLLLYNEVNRRQGHQEVDQWLQFAHQRLLSAKEGADQAELLLDRISEVDPKYRDSMQRNLDFVRTRQMADNLHARIFLMLAVQREGATTPIWARTALKSLWLADLERELIMGHELEAKRLYRELENQIRNPAVFTLSVEERERLKRIEEQLGAVQVSELRP